MRHYTSEFYYYRWLAIYLHFSTDKFDFFKYNKRAGKGKINHRIEGRLRSVVLRFSEDIIDEVMIANFVEYFHQHHEASSAWLFEYSLEEMEKNHKRWRSRLSQNQRIAEDDFWYLLKRIKIDNAMGFDNWKYQGIENLSLEKDPFNKIDGGILNTLCDFRRSADNLPHLMHMFLEGITYAEILLYINKVVANKIEGKTFLDIWAKEYAQTDSFPNFQKTFLFLYKYATMLKRIELNPHFM